MRDLAITHLFDIGANVGTFSWPAINLTPELEVYLFEPDPVNIKLLKKTIEKNRLGHVHLWEGVVDRQAGEVEFMLDPASGAAGSIKDFSRNAATLHAQYGMSRRRKVRATTLDSHLELPNSSDARIFLKIDVEGAEGDVLEGGRAFVQKFRPVMIVECFETKSLEPVRGMNYAAFDLRENGNILLIPREQVATLMDLKIISRETPVPAGW
jgi:FkbM family methyltransferase